MDKDSLQLPVPHSNVYNVSLSVSPSSVDVANDFALVGLEQLERNFPVLNQSTDEVCASVQKRRSTNVCHFKFSVVEVNKCMNATLSILLLIYFRIYFT